jgi:hypothetical protein
MRCFFPLTFFHFFTKYTTLITIERAKENKSLQFECVFTTGLFELGRQARPDRQTDICLYRLKGKKNPGDTGSRPKQLHIRGDT